MQYLELLCLCGPSDGADNVSGHSTAYLYCQDNDFETGESSISAKH